MPGTFLYYFKIQLYSCFNHSLIFYTLQMILCLILSVFFTKASEI